MLNKKIILSISIFLFINLPLNTGFADRDISALGGLKGIYVNLKVNDRTPQGVPKQRIDKKMLLKYIEKKLINTIGKQRGIRLFKVVDPHLNVNITIEAEEHHADDRTKQYTYYVTVKASLERNAAEWYWASTRPWTENKKSINMWKKNVREAIVKLDKAKKAIAPSGLNQKTYRTNEINYATSQLTLAKKMLASNIKKYAIGRTAELGFTQIANYLLADYIVAKRKEDEYKRNEQEVKGLSNQLGYKEETAFSRQINEGAVQYANRNIDDSTATTYQSGNHVQKVLNDHPDYINVIDSQMFKDYVNNLSMQQLETAIRIKEFGTAEEIIQLISNYKSQEGYQELHRLMIKSVIDNYSVFDESLSINILQDWTNKEENNAKVIKLSVTDNSSSRFKQTYLITYTIAKGTNQQEYMYEYNTNTKSTRKMVSLHGED